MLLNEKHPPVKFGKTGVLIINLGHGVLPDTDPNMMDYLVKTVKDY